MKYALALLSILSVALVALLWRQKDALILKERGSFYVGGENVARDFVELGSFRAADTVTINQMYVEYMKPVGKQRIPVVLTHGAVLIGHSQSGHYPLESALINPEKVKGMVLLEAVPPVYSDEQIAALAKIPLLIVYGDHLESSTEGAPTTWRQRFNECAALVDRVNKAGGNAQMIHLPAKGMRGNTHMFMQDKNNLAVADLIIGWIKENIK